MTPKNVSTSLISPRPIHRELRRFGPLSKEALAEVEALFRVGDPLLDLLELLPKLQHLVQDLRIVAARLAAEPPGQRLPDRTLKDPDHGPSDGADGDNPGHHPGNRHPEIGTQSGMTLLTFCPASGCFTGSPPGQAANRTVPAYGAMLQDVSSRATSREPHGPDPGKRDCDFDVFIICRSEVDLEGADPGVDTDRDSDDLLIAVDRDPDQPLVRGRVPQQVDDGLVLDGAIRFSRSSENLSTRSDARE